MKDKKPKGVVRIERWLNKIGYSLSRYRMYGAWIVDSKGKKTDWMVRGEDTCIEYGNRDSSMSCCFYLKNLKIKTDKDKRTDPDTCISFRAKNSESVFIQFYNFDNK